MGRIFLYCYVVNNSPLEVQYFAPGLNDSHILNETVYDAFIEDFTDKINPPKVIQKGRLRKFYTFE